MAKPKLGQVFLNNHSVVESIVNALHPESDETIIEIGPGKGVLTEALVKTGCKVIAIELDNHLYDMLLKKFKNKSNISFIHADILNISLSEVTGTTLNDKVKIVGNIPYYITSPILEFLVSNKKFYKMSLIMMQKEVGERILSSIDSRKYGALTLYIQYHMAVEKILDVSREDFLPEPDVDSIILKFCPYKEPKIKVKDESLFFEIINIAFQKRRKMIHNSLAILEKPEYNLNVQKLLDTAQIASSLRAENLTIEDYARLSNLISDKTGSRNVFK